jgi:exonuclease VII small subunit
MDTFERAIKEESAKAMKTQMASTQDNLNSLTKEANLVAAQKTETMLAEAKEAISKLESKVSHLEETITGHEESMALLRKESEERLLALEQYKGREEIWEQGKTETAQAKAEADNYKGRLEELEHVLKTLGVVQPDKGEEPAKKPGKKSSAKAA